MPFIFQENYPISIVFVTIIIAYMFKLHQHTKLTDNIVFHLSDSIGLSIFAFTGAVIGLESEFNFAGVVFLSFLTAVGGGIIRDMMMNKVPFVLINDFYGTIAIVIGILVWLFNEFSYLNTTTTFGILSLGLLLRLLAIKYKWKLPKLI